MAGAGWAGVIPLRTVAGEPVTAPWSPQTQPSPAARAVRESWL
jgi:hypothetical protein